MRTAFVQRNESAPPDEQWEACWLEGEKCSVVASLPTESRAWGFADLITAIQPFDAQLSELTQRVSSLEADRHDLQNQLEDIRKSLA